MMKPTMRCSALLALLAATVTACDSDGPGEPGALTPATIAISLQFPEGLESSSGLHEAYLKTNRLYVQFRDQTDTREEQQVDFQPGVQESHYPMTVRLRSPVETLNFKLEVRLGPAPVFRGETPVTLRAGRLTEVRTTLNPVLAGVRAPGAASEITAWGDSLHLGAAAILATGDTIEGVLITWASLDPDIASIDAGGTVVGLSDGTARMVAFADAYSDIALVSVRAEVANAAISPAGDSIPLNATRQYTVSLFDRRENLLPPRPVTWSSSDVSIVSIDQEGLAHAVGVGSVMIDVTVDSVGTATEATAIPIAPEVDSLEAVVTGPNSAALSARVTPNGASTDAWFEWGDTQSQTPTLPSLLRPVPVGAGLLARPLAAPLTTLRPNTLYYALARASNAAGPAVSDTIWFTTPPPGLESLKVVTNGWAQVQPGWVVLIGAVETGGGDAETWFEWGADPTLQKATSTPLDSVAGSGWTTVTALVELPAEGTYYFRFVGRNGAGSAYGAILSLAWYTPPDVTTDPPETLFEEGVALNGTVNPHGWATTTWFQWSNDPSLSTFTETDKQSVGAGTAPVPFKDSLPAGTKGYYRAVAESPGGRVFGDIVKF